MKMTVFWDVTPCRLVEFYRRLALMMEAASTSETSVNFFQNTRCNIPKDIFRRAYCLAVFAREKEECARLLSVGRGGEVAKNIIHHNCIPTTTNIAPVVARN
jgi:hypothetical protein